MRLGAGPLDATIVIPQHDRAKLTIGVVRELRAHEPVQWPIVVVDDGSRCDAAEAVEGSCGDVRLLRQPHRGVTAAWNHGLREVSTPLVVLLNNDVRIDGAWVAALLQPLRDGVAKLSGVELRRERAAPAAVLERLGRCEFVSGWCWAFRTEDVRGLGGFDESLRMYFSDTDLQARLLGAPDSAGRPAIISRLPVRHIGHCSTRLLAERRAIWRRDRARFVEKWTKERA